MSYGDLQASAEQGDPVQCFLFRYGTEPGEHYAYTDHTDELVIDHGAPLGEITYAPVPIERDKIESNGTLDKSALKIGTDLGTELAEIFRVYPPSSVVTLTVYEGHLTDADSEFVVTWAGRIVSASRDEGELQLSGEPVSTSMRRPGLRRHYQYGCMHQLYGPQCKTDKPSKTLPATLTAIVGATVTLDMGWYGPYPPAKFQGGLMEWPSATGSIQRRTILRVTGNTLSLSGLPYGLEAGDAVSVVLGCNHKPFATQDGDCEALHDNLPNYGGCPWIPLKNPIGTFNNYY